MGRRGRVTVYPGLPGLVLWMQPGFTLKMFANELYGHLMRETMGDCVVPCGQLRVSCSQPPMRGGGRKWSPGAEWDREKRACGEGVWPLAEGHSPLRVTSWRNPGQSIIWSHPPSAFCSPAQDLSWLNWTENQSQGNLLPQFWQVSFLGREKGVKKTERTQIKETSHRDTHAGGEGPFTGHLPHRAVYAPCFFHPYNRSLRWDYTHFTTEKSVSKMSNLPETVL